MGIPSYYKKIVDEFPNIIYSKNLHNKINDRVFLDFNCGIHQCNVLLKKTSICDYQEFEKLLIKETLNYIDEIYYFTNPKKLLYISIDGIPSRSKIIQQRNRRFTGMWKKNQTLDILSSMKKCSKGNKNNEIENLINKINNEWSSDNISPGTIFMKNMCDSIRKHIQNYPIKCILSDYNEPGEGEFKIVKYIRDHKNEYLDKPTDIIYGLDADLIMLSLIINESSVYLLREPVFFDTKNTDKFLYFDINLLYQKIIVNLTRIYNINETDNNLLIHVYVFLCIFLGNDFLPNLSYIEIKNNGIDILLKTYSLLFERYKIHIIYLSNNEWSINNEILFKYINLLSRNEDQMFIEYDNSYYNYNNNNKFNNSNSCELSNQVDHIINNQFSKFKDIIKPTHSKWRQRYYYYLFGNNEGNYIQNICLNYFEGLHWVLNYYFNQYYYQTWYYRFNYSPTILDISNYLEIILTKDNLVNIIYDQKLYPNINITVELQLLMILPISSINLLESKYKRILTDIKSGFIHNYPYNTTFDIYLKKFTWQFIPKLPDFDILELYEFLNQN